MTKQQVYAIYVTRWIFAGGKFRGDPVNRVSFAELFEGRDTSNPNSPSVELRGERLQRLLDMEVRSLCE